MFEGDDRKNHLHANLFTGMLHPELRILSFCLGYLTISFDNNNHGQYLRDELAKIIFTILV